MAQTFGTVPAPWPKAKTPLPPGRSLGGGGAGRQLGHGDPGGIRGMVWIRHQGKGCRLGRMLFRPPAPSPLRDTAVSIRRRLDPRGRVDEGERPRRIAERASFQRFEPGSDVFDPDRSRDPHVSRVRVQGSELSRKRRKLGEDQSFCRRNSTGMRTHTATATGPFRAGSKRQRVTADLAASSSSA
jgi:hypothetical protein